MTGMFLVTPELILLCVARPKHATPIYFPRIKAQSDCTLSQFERTSTAGVQEFERTSIAGVQKFGRTIGGRCKKEELRI